MKGKFYAAALAALALTACSQDEELTSVKQNGSVSPIAFNVTFGEQPGVGTKAEFGGTHGYTLMWTAKDKDKMSLFHGLTTVPAATPASITGGGNAIYEAQGNASDGGVMFTTHSMVEDGQAIMVYPADTTFAYKKNKLYVSVPENQTEASRKLLPFMSEGLNIADWEEGANDGAGYARNYEIAMKQVGTLFTLKTVWDNDEPVKTLAEADEIIPINVTSVALTRPTDKFNTKLEVKLSNATPAYATKVEGRDDWNAVSVVDYAGGNATQVETLTTEAVSGLETSEFVILPQEKASASAGNDASVKIYTRYGSVTVDDSDEETMWGTSKESTYTEKNKGKVSEALEDVIEKYSAWKQTDTDSKFYNEQVGVHVTRYIDADLATLDMSDVCIKDDKHLHDILLVHDAYQKGQDLTLTIDGNADGVFEMSMATEAMLQARPEVGLKACTKPGHACTTIRLIGGGEIPSINWIKDGVGGSNLDIVLAAGETPWTWTGGTRNMHKVNVLTNLGTINIAETATVGFTNLSNGFAGIVNNGILNINGGVTTFTGTSTLTLNVTNNKTINIAQGAELRSGEYCIFTNESSAATEMGNIFNSGIFATVNGGVINNYGLIQNMLGGTANMTYITTNATGKAKFENPYSATNKFGTIVLKNADDNISVSNATAEGFIKYEYTDVNYVTPEVCKYNYIIVKNHDITFSAEAKELQFIEVVGESSMPVITNPNAERFITLDGFILKGEANLKENNKLVTKAAYIQGTLYYGGTFVQSGTSTVPTTTGTYLGNSSENCLVKF